jgi:hypothetical protein
MLVIYYCRSIRSFNKTLSQLHRLKHTPYVTSTIMPTGNPVWLARNSSMSNTDYESQWTVTSALETPSRSLLGSIRKGLSRKSSNVSTQSNTSATSQEPQPPSFRDPADLNSLNFQQASLGEDEARRRSPRPLTNPSCPGMNEPPPAYTPSLNATSGPTRGALPSELAAPSSLSYSPATPTSIPATVPSGEDPYAFLTTFDTTVSY